MNAALSRRAGAKLVASFGTTARRSQAVERHLNGRTMQHHATRPLSSIPRRNQQPVTATASQSPNPPTQSTAKPSQPTNPTPTSTAKPTQSPNDLTPSAPTQPSPLLNLDAPAAPLPTDDPTQPDWTRSYHGLSSTPFTPDQSAILMQPLTPTDIEIKPDGIIYLPEIKYRRILNRAFGPGGWGLAPRSETIVTQKLVTREYGLVCNGRLVSIARGEQQYFDPEGVPTATEGCKSNALMRCCKDLGVASELWDPRFIKGFLREWGRETVVEHQTTKRRRKHFMRKDDEVKWPFKEVGAGTGVGSGSGSGGAAAGGKK